MASATVDSPAASASVAPTFAEGCPLLNDVDGEVAHEEVGELLWSGETTNGSNECLLSLV